MQTFCSRSICTRFFIYQAFPLKRFSVHRHLYPVVFFTASFRLTDETLSSKAYSCGRFNEWNFTAYKALNCFMIIVLITLFLKRFLIDKVIHFQSENRIDKESYLVELSLPFLIFSSFAVGIHLPIFLIVQ